MADHLPVLDQESLHFYSALDQLLENLKSSGEGNFLFTFCGKYYTNMLPRVYSRILMHPCISAFVQVLCQQHTSHVERYRHGSLPSPQANRR